MDDKSKSSILDALHIKGTQKPVAASAETPKKIFYLNGSSASDWVDKYYNESDLRFMEKELLIRPHL